MAKEIGVAYLSVKPKVDNSFDSDLEGAGSKGGRSFGGAFAVAAGNLISDAVSKLASAAADTFKDAFASIADYEQLAGGVEKIFDQADIAGILNDAQAAYKDLNMSANEYLASINQTGAAFAQTMGDQKGYDTARQGMKAIADYASGTGRSVDELTEKYSMITRATSSYQSIADQFSGILPATSADFLAQAQAAGFLSGEYQKLTDVPVAEYQQAVSAMLEKGVTDMGLYGNTAAESTETISGSLAMLRASWTNFITELGKSDGDVTARAQELTESIIAVVQNIAPRLHVFAQGLFAAIPSLITELQPYIDEFMAQVSTFIEEHRPEIEAAANQLFDGIASALSTILEKVIQKLIEGLGEFVGNIPQWYPKLVQASNSLFLAIVKGLVNGLVPFFAELEKSMTQALNDIGSFFMGFYDSGAKIVDSIIRGIQSAISGVGDAIGRVIDAITHPLETAQGTVQWIVDRITGIFNGMNLQLPSIALPHFSVWGGEFPFGIAGEGSPPEFSVEWYAKGGFVDGATLIGAGERGPEMILPQQGALMDTFASNIAQRIGGGVDIHDCTFNVRNDGDIRKVAQELNMLINRQQAGAFA